MAVGQLALTPQPVVACRPGGDTPASGRLQAFAEEWGMGWVDAPGDDPLRFTLSLDNGRIGLIPPLDRPDLGSHPLVIDFAADPRFARPLARKDVLARATGWKAGYRPPVVDLTTGLGRDAWALASGGCEVTAVERHPVVWLLLTDALERAKTDQALAATAARIHPVFGDVLGEHPPALAGNQETVWYLDPMFPERKKSALVKKPMRIFHQLVGEDPDSEALFAWARRQPGARWVVKRPPGAPSIDATIPAIDYRSGRLRFDVYLARPTA